MLVIPFPTHSTSHSLLASADHIVVFPSSFFHLCLLHLLADAATPPRPDPILPDIPCLPATFRLCNHRDYSTQRTYFVPTFFFVRTSPTPSASPLPRRNPRQTFIASASPTLRRTTSTPSSFSPSGLLTPLNTHCHLPLLCAHIQDACALWGLKDRPAQAGASVGHHHPFALPRSRSEWRRYLHRGHHELAAAADGRALGAPPRLVSSTC